MTFLIIHGVSGFAGKHWMGWLYDELAKQGHSVIMPTLPNADDPNREEWLKVLEDIVKNLNTEELVIIGHSLGSPAALDLISTTELPLKGLISVSGFYEDYGAELNTKYMQKVEIDISLSKDLIKHKFVVYGDNDPYVPQNILQNLATGLEVEPVIIKNGGHLNTDAGYTEFPLILEFIDEMI